MKQKRSLVKKWVQTKKRLWLSVENEPGKCEKNPRQPKLPGILIKA